MSVSDLSTALVIYTPPPTPAPPSAEIRPIPSKFKRVMKKIWHVVKIILKVIGSVAVFITNPALFITGFVIGVIVPKHVQNAIDKIKVLCKKMVWAPILIFGGALFLAPHMTWATGSVLVGAAVGKTLYYKARSKQKPPPTAAAST